MDLRPTREFPADGAAGEGFTNAAEALSDISPALLTKYLNAAKDVAEHAVLLPDGFRFSLSKTRRDWTNESLARLRAFYAEYTADGRLPLQPYLTATVRHREALTSGKTTLEEVARKEKLRPKYLRVLWQTLTDKTPSSPLDLIRARWRQAAEKDVGSLAAEIAAWQTALWKFVRIGSYRHGNTGRQVANDPAASESQPVRITVKPAAGQSEVVLRLVTRDASSDGKGRYAVWHRPRFESAGKPILLLRDCERVGLAKERFGKHPTGKPAEEASLVVDANTVTEVRLPAALFRDREFVVEGKLDAAAGDRVVQFQVLTAPPGPDARWDGKSPVVASPNGTAYKQLLQGHADFRRCFPWFICFPAVVPADEVVCLKMYHREDEPLARLFLDDEQKRRLDRLWDEHRVHQPAAGGREQVSAAVHRLRDPGPAEGAAGVLRGPAASPSANAPRSSRRTWRPRSRSRLEALLDFAARAYRRPLREKEKTDLHALYQALRKKGVPPRGSVPRRAGPGAGVAGVPVPHRTGAAGEGTRPGRTTGNSPPGSAISSGRRRPTTNCAGSPPRVGSATRRFSRRKRGGC